MRGSGIARRRNSLKERETTPWHSDERIELYNSLFPILPEFVAHYTVGLERGDKVGLPDKHSLRLRRDILAALIADKLDISTAYAKRRYTDERDQSRWLGLTDKIDDVYNEGRACFGWYISFERDQIPANDASFRGLSMQFFYRSMGSLDAAKRLAELGYLCEVANILRSTLEQFAFCSKLTSLIGTEELKTIKPIHSLNHFKKYVPAAGQLYGLMSKYTHFEYDHHTHFFTYGPDKVQTIQKGPILRAYATQLLFITMVCVAKYILAVSPTKFSSVPKYVQDTNFFIERVYKYSDDVCYMLPLDEILAKMDILLQDIVRKAV
jgi:hypothetical protein